MTLVKLKSTARRKPSANRCEASNYRLVGRDFYTVSHVDGKTVCDYCGKAVNVRTFNGAELIPAHNKP